MAVSSVREEETVTAPNDVLGVTRASDHVRTFLSLSSPTQGRATCMPA